MNICTVCGVLLQIYKRKKADAITVLHGLVVRIPGFHPGGPGSIPGVGTFYLNRKLEVSF